MTTIYGNSKHFDVQKIAVAAAIGGTQLTVKDERLPSHIASWNPRPVATTNEHVYVGPTPISWLVSNGKLRGSGKTEEADVLCWMNFGETSLRPAIMGWTLPATSCMPNDHEAAARADAERYLEFLNDYLLSKTFLVGERMSLADLSVAFNLLPAYQHVLEPAAAQKYGNVTRFFHTIMNQPDVAKVAGTVTLCKSAATFNAQTYKQNASKISQASTSKQSDKKDGKKDKKAEKGGDKKDKKKEKTPAAEEEMDEAELIVQSEESKKDPFADLPKGTFNMDEFKRTYSNEDTETKAIPYFWDKFDSENYSIWHCTYKYPEDLTLIFMSCNLMSGMMQRLDKMRKCAFGSMCLFGENNNSQIGGLWFWRGHELAFELSSDWQVDYGSYEWKKLDINAPETKRMVKEYFLWEGEFPEYKGLKFNQGKIFK